MSEPSRFVETFKIRFADCDAAGIMFYPNAFKLANAIIEDWFGEMADMPFSRMHLDLYIGVPTVHVEAEFRTPCRLGEEIDLCLSVVKMGKSSLDIIIEASVTSIIRFIVRPKLVFVDLKTMKSIPVPPWAVQACKLDARPYLPGVSDRQN
jgi:4-hydroxybenzoyl-CoA thioesterase